MWFLPWRTFDDSTVNRNHRSGSSCKPTKRSNVRRLTSKTGKPSRSEVVLIWWVWWDIWCIRKGSQSRQWPAPIFWACLLWRWNRSFCKKQCQTHKSLWTPYPSMNTSKIFCQQNGRKLARSTKGQQCAQWGGGWGTEIRLQQEKMTLILCEML